MIPRLIVVFMIVALESAAIAAPSAEELFHQGQTFFDKGDYASAVAKWNESYRLSTEPELLFMIGQAFENDGRCAEDARDISAVCRASHQTRSTVPSLINSSAN